MSLSRQLSFSLSRVYVYRKGFSRRLLRGFFEKERRVFDWLLETLFNVDGLQDIEENLKAISGLSTRW